LDSKIFQANSLDDAIQMIDLICLWISFILSIGLLSMISSGSARQVQLAVGKAFCAIAAIHWQQHALGEEDLTTIGSVLPLLQSPGCRILSRFFHSVLWRWEWIRMDYIMENNSDLVNF
jgi:hypothetical protein